LKKLITSKNHISQYFSLELKFRVFPGNYHWEFPANPAGVMERQEHSPFKGKQPICNSNSGRNNRVYVKIVLYSSATPLSEGKMVMNE
jgi:hypothetical protein